jgi:hypothetical protein
MSVILLIVNAVLLLTVFVITVIMLRAGSRHDFHYGMSEVQDPLKRHIIRLLFIMIVISFVAAVFNILWPMFWPDW